MHHGIGKKGLAYRRAACLHGLRRGTIILTAVALLSSMPGQVRAASTDIFPLDAIGRLIVDNQRVCTAFIVLSVKRSSREPRGGRMTLYENWLASAGHCYGQDLVFRQNNSQYHISRVLGFSAGQGETFDVMVASFYTYSPMPTLVPAFGEYPRVGDPLMLIGYGRKALMMRVGALLEYDERGHMLIDGYASPGNSGGPVLIPGTRRVVGIGIETTLDRPEGASFLHCVVVSCAPKPPYVASHIDRLQGVANFTLVRAERP